MAEAGDIAAANALFLRTKGCRSLPLNAAEDAARDALIASLDPDETAVERQILAIRKAQHPHCAALTRLEADQELRIALLAARLGNNEARVHYWLHGEAPQSTDQWRRDRARADFEREANALLDAAVAEGDGMALVRRAESYREGRYVSANPVRAYAFSYASLRRGGPPTPERISVLRSTWARDLSPEAVIRAEMLGEEIFRLCCSKESPKGGTGL